MATCDSETGRPLTCNEDSYHTDDDEAEFGATCTVCADVMDQCLACNSGTECTACQGGAGWRSTPNAET